MRKLMYLLSLTAFMAAIFVCLPARAMTVDVSDISNRAYGARVLTEINQAQKEIYVAMYSMYVHDGQLDNPADSLVQALIDARNRGVAVKVYLDDSSSNANANNDAYQMLVGAKVDTFFIKPELKMHAKLIVIDGETTIDGSANWTRSALLKNFESNIVIRSREFAQVKLAFFKALAENTVTPVDVTPVAAERIEIPAAFLTEAKFAPRMVTDMDGLAFDLYLILLRDIFLRNSSALAVDYPALAQRLGLKGEYTQTFLHRALERLKDKYHLIDFTAGRRPVVTVVPIAGNFFYLPGLYWDYGLASQLLLKEKFAYLISSCEQSLALPRPYWSRSKEELKKEYHITVNVLGEGLRGLEQKDLLDIRSSKATSDDFGDRTANEYYLKPLISTEERARVWAALEDSEGKDKVSFACGLAHDALGEENHLDTVKEFIRFIKQYKMVSIQKAVKIVGAYRANNPLKNVRFLEGVIKNIEAGTYPPK